MAVKDGMVYVDLAPNERQIAFGLSRFLEDIDDLREFWPEFEDELLRFLSEQFETEGSRGQGGAWAPLSPAYARAKAKRYPGQPILVARGDLKKMMTVKSNIISQHFRDSYVLWASKIALWHQTGTARMPARKIVSLTTQDLRRFGKVLHLWAHGKTKEMIREMHGRDIQGVHAARARHRLPA